MSDTHNEVHARLKSICFNGNVFIYVGYLIGLFYIIIISYNIEPKNQIILLQVLIINFTSLKEIKLRTTVLLFVIYIPKCLRKKIKKKD